VAGAARLNAEADAVLAARAAGQSQWGSELSPLFLQKLLELLRWEPAVCSIMQAVCSTWCSILDALLPRLHPRRSLAVMQGKLGWYQSVVEVDLSECEEEDASGVLAELRSLPSLRSLKLPASCAERAVDAEAVCGLTTLTTLRFYVELDEYGDPVEAAGEWVLDLRRLTTLNRLDLSQCFAVTDKEVVALSNLTRLTYLSLVNCINVTAEGLRTMSSLVALTTLILNGCPNVTDEVLRAVSSLTGLTVLGLNYCDKVTAKGLRAVSSLTRLTYLSLYHCPSVTAEALRAMNSLTALNRLNLSGCANVTDDGLRALSSHTALTSLYLGGCPVTDEGLRVVSSLAALRTLNLFDCPNLTAVAKQALRTAIPNLTIRD
jgi:F-box/leucine-rich repeat protein 14